MNLDYLNIHNSKYKRNSSADHLIEDSIALKEGVIGLNGALMVDTGEFSGRIPNDKFIVDEENSSENIWWGNVNQKISEQNFEHLLNKVIATYDELDNDFYVFDGFAGDDKDSSLNVRMVTKKAWQSLFVNNMFIRPKKEELENFLPDFTIINAYDVKEQDWKEYGLNSENFIVFNLKKKIAIIGGGVSGVSSALLLQEKHEITLFEKNNYVGGHTNTILVEDEPGKKSSSRYGIYCL